MHESDRIPQQLHALIRKLEIKKTADNGKETVVRLIRLIQYYGDALFRTVILQVVGSGGSFGENTFISNAYSYTAIAESLLILSPQIQSIRHFFTVKKPLNPTDSPII